MEGDDLELLDAWAAGDAAAVELFYWEQLDLQEIATWLAELRERVGR